MRAPRRRRPAGARSWHRPLPACPPGNPARGTPPRAALEDGVQPRSTSSSAHSTSRASNVPVGARIASRARPRASLASAGRRPRRRGPRAPSIPAAAVDPREPAGQAGQAAPPGRRRARRGLGPARPARLRDHRRRRHGIRRSSCSSCSRRTAAGSRRRCGSRFGACVSAAAVGAAFWVRSRYGQLQMSLGAAGAGIAGGYATLAAAAARYDLVPDWARAAARRRPRRARRRDRDRVVVRDGRRDRAARCGARPCPAGDRHRAVVARRGVRGDHLRRNGRARRAASLAQAPDRDRGCRRSARLRCSRSMPTRSAGAGTTAVVASFVLVVLAAGIWLQLVSEDDRPRSARERRSRSPPSAWRSCSSGRCGTSTATRASRSPARPWSGPSPGSRSAASSLPWPSCSASRRSSLAAVATADLLSGTSIALTWSVEALLLSFIAPRMRDARLQATALVYCAITAAHVLLVDAPPKLIFDAPVPGMAAASVAALAAALLGAGILAPAEAMARTEIRAPRVARPRPHLACSASGRAAGGPRPRRRRSRHLRRRDPAHRLLLPPRPPRGDDRRRGRRCRRRRDLVAAELRRARRRSLAWVGGVFAIATGLRCARVRGRRDPPLVRRLGADRRLGGRARCLLRVPAPLPRGAPDRHPGRRRRARARRIGRRHRPHLTRG